MNKGTIFSIEEFAINDGPGIRTTVFLKGCPLRCAWCHNPEGLSPLPQKMETMDGPRICGEEVDAGTLADRILKDKDFLKMNNGGVTFTGGEPTFQPAFLIEVLELLRGEIHRAIETSGFCPGEVFEAVLRETDYILFDIKHADDEVHKRYTRASNLLIKENLHRLVESDKPFVVRVPLIPGVNDTIQNMDDIAELIANAGNLQRVELLKYHKTAGAKYSRIGMTYNPPFDTELAPAVHTEAFDKRKIKTLIL